MVDVDKLSDGELRTKLIEFGFPVMPITGTTRKVMVRKLKLLLENQNKVGSSDGRRSLGRYSSEEDSDADVKTTKNQKNRRATMAAPVSSTGMVTRKSVVEPVLRSPKKQIRTTTSTTTRSSRIMQAVKDDFDTGSDSESDILASSKSKPDSGSNNDDSYGDVGLNSRSSALKSPLSTSSSRYTSPKSDDFGYSSTRDSNFYAPPSPSRYTSTFSEIGGTGSGSATYGTDKLNQVRARLSLGNPAHEKPSSYNPIPASSNVTLTEHDTPFLSNFTRRLSALSAAKKAEHDKNDLVKEHDSNGFTPYTRRPYVSKTTRGRESIYDLKARRDGSDRKSNFVSYAVLAVVALFFIVLAVVYLGMASDTSVVSSGYISPICDPEEIESKKGVHCLLKDHVQSAINLLNVLRPELQKKSLAYHCTDPTIKPQMTEAEIVKFCLTNYAVNNAAKIKNDLRNLEVMIFLNPEWKIDVAQTDTNEGAATKENIVKNMEQVLFNIDKKVTSLVMLHPELPYKCVIYNYFVSALYSLAMLGIIFAALFVLRLSLKFYGRYEQKQKEEVNSMVEKILDILQNTTSEGADINYVVINHVRDAILNVNDRTAKQKLWEKAVKYISENESRVRTEVQSVHGESFDVWRWIGSANLSMTGNSPRKGVWQGQAFDTDPGAANSLTHAPTPCLKIRGMLEEGAGPLAATAARDAVLSKIAHRCRILHCHAEVQCGVVYLKCGNEDDASVAFKNLHGWWYSGQLVTVKYLRMERYQERFPDAPSGPPYLRSAKPCDD
ncbi:inner nuclear membrane protein Man1 isoform X2 [Dendroctonus ponderosae]|uniref:LEM domain-containing protein n=1 Tax=Dendroctonus ponderosae TaxID=77166 RepID=A0AAR5Q8Q4_DENPD|nr:inner nuclear membrane protein Man1 isoform X2 [Dendroctonus ponderosae]